MKQTFLHQNNAEMVPAKQAKQLFHSLKIKSGLAMKSAKPKIEKIRICYQDNLQHKKTSKRDSLLQVSDVPGGKLNQGDRWLKE